MNKSTFLLRHLVKGLLWFAVLVIIYILVKKYVKVDFLAWLAPIYEKPTLVYTIYSVSELVVGIIPPEVFMIWALRDGDPSVYIGHVVLLTVISYLAGVVAYFIGSYLNQTKFYRTLEKNFFGKYAEQVEQYGGFLIIVAAVTPVPYSGICMLMGAMKYPFTKLLLFSSTRFLRFGVYAYIIWAAHYF